MVYYRFIKLPCIIYNMIDIYIKNKYGFFDLIHPWEKASTEKIKQNPNNTKCSFCRNIPIIFKVRCIQRPIRTFYICYNCSQNQENMHYNFGNAAAQFLKEQNNTYPNFE